jgi:DNA topoisomerase I
MRRMTDRSRLPSAWRRLDHEQKRKAATSRRMRAVVRAHVGLAPAESAKAAGLRYVNDETLPGIRRLAVSKGFRYVAPNGRAVTDHADLQRIRSLVVPPAWRDVWICPLATGHVQATGRDARGRKQYRYHPRWREVRDEVKYGRLVAFARALPRIRQRTDADLRRSGLPREKVLAAVVQLLEKTLIRVGNEEYARQNRSFGLTTMRDQHAKIQGSTVRFEFRGKSGIEHAVDLHERRLATIIKACRDLPGYELFQYVDEQGHLQMIDSADVNAYVREICGEDFTAKDFRTWAGTVLAAQALAEFTMATSAAEAKRNIAEAVAAVSKRLGNTKAVCRKCYIHPAVLEAYVDGATIRTVRPRAGGAKRGRVPLSAEESAVVALLLKKRGGESFSKPAA